MMLLLSLNCVSQEKIAGTTVSVAGASISGVEIYNKSSGLMQYSDENGRFLIEVDAPGIYELIFYKESF